MLNRSKLKLLTMPKAKTTKRAIAGPAAQLRINEAVKYRNANPDISIGRIDVKYRVDKGTLSARLRGRKPSNSRGGLNQTRRRQGRGARRRAASTRSGSP